MAETPAKQPQAAGNTAPLGPTKEVVVEGRDARNLPAPEHGDPTEQAPPAQGETVLGVRVGSEASVESGIDPVLPGTGGLSDATRVRNRDLRERDEKERKRRGLTGSMARAISVSFEGPMIIERYDEDEKTPEKEMFSGSFSGFVPEGGLLIRALTPEEEAEIFGPVDHKARRANDLVAGGGQGGGGNPMHAGDVRGVSSGTDKAVGQGGVTSKTGQAPGARPAATGGPQGGGTTTRG